MTNSSLLFRRSKCNFSLTVVLMIFSSWVAAQPTVGIELDTATEDGIIISGAGDDGIEIRNSDFGQKRKRKVKRLIQHCPRENNTLVA